MSPGTLAERGQMLDASEPYRMINPESPAVWREPAEFV